MTEPFDTASGAVVAHDLITWLRTQLDSDERMAHEATGITAHRLLRQVQAHKAILDDLAAVIRDDEDLTDFSNGHVGLHVAQRTLKLLASIYCGGSN